MSDQTASGLNADTQASPSQLIDARIKELDDWRGEALARVRSLIKEADPEAIEEWKWRGVPVWSHSGIVCTWRDLQECRKADLRQGRRA